MALNPKSGVCFVLLLCSILGSSFCTANVILSRETNSNFQQSLQQIQDVAGGIFAQAVASRISQHIQHLQSPNFPLLPLLPGYPFPAETCTDPASVEWTLVDTPEFNVHLSINFTTDMATRGLDTLVDFITFRTMPSGSVEVFWKLDFPTLNLLSDYDIKLNVTDKTEGTKSLTFHIGSKNAALLSENYSFSIFAEAKAFPLYEKLTLTQLNVNTEFPQISWDANWLIETILGNGTTTTIIDEVADIGEDFKNILKGISDTLSNVQLQCFINFVINECAISDLVNENYECLNWDLGEAPCFNDPWKAPEITTRATHGMLATCAHVTDITTTTGVGSTTAGVVSTTPGAGSTEPNESTPTVTTARPTTPAAATSTELPETTTSDAAVNGPTAIMMASIALWNMLQ